MNEDTESTPHLIPVNKIDKSHCHEHVNNFPIDQPVQEFGEGENNNQPSLAVHRHSETKLKTKVSFIPVKSVIFSRYDNTENSTDPSMSHIQNDHSKQVKIVNGHQPSNTMSKAQYCYRLKDTGRKERNMTNRNERVESISGESHVIEKNAYADEKGTAAANICTQEEEDAREDRREKEEKKMYGSNSFLTNDQLPEDVKLKALRKHILKITNQRYMSKYNSEDFSDLTKSIEQDQRDGATLDRYRVPHSEQKYEGPKTFDEGGGESGENTDSDAEMIQSVEEEDIDVVVGGSAAVGDDVEMGTDAGRCDDGEDERHRTSTEKISGENVRGISNVLRHMQHSSDDKPTEKLVYDKSGFQTVKKKYRWQLTEKI